MSALSFFIHLIFQAFQVQLLQGTEQTVFSINKKSYFDHLPLFCFFCAFPAKWHAEPWTSVSFCLDRADIFQIYSWMCPRGGFNQRCRQFFLSCHTVGSVDVLLIFGRNFCSPVISSQSIYCPSMWGHFGKIKEIFWKNPCNQTKLSTIVNILEQTETML